MIRNVADGAPRTAALSISKSPRRTPIATINDGSPCEHKPAHDGDAGQDRGDQMTKQRGGGDSTREGGEIRHDVVDGRNESPVHHVGDSYQHTTREGDGQEDAHHGRSLADASQNRAAPDGATRSECREEARSV